MRFFDWTCRIVFPMVLFLSGPWTLSARASVFAFETQPGEGSTFDCRLVMADDLPATATIAHAALVIRTNRPAATISRFDIAEGLVHGPLRSAGTPRSDGEPGHEVLFAAAPARLGPVEVFAPGEPLASFRVRVRDEPVTISIQVYEEAGGLRTWEGRSIEASESPEPLATIGAIVSQ